MTIMSDLPRDLLAEILSRVPLTSLRAVRFTCKKWNDLSKDRSFLKKQIVEAKKKQLKLKEFEVIMMRNFRVYLTSVDLHSDVVPSFTHKGTLISLNDDANHHQVDNVSRVFHCDGLLFCITNDFNSRLVVWNPYFGQIRWIKPRNSYHIMDSYSLGYDDNKNHKILRFKDNYYAYSAQDRICEFELYSFKSNSWKVVLDVTPDWDIESYYRGLSLQGNTYWYAKEKLGRGRRDDVDFLICFDFTTERFGPPLPLPFNSSPTWEDIVTLSSVGEDQLAVLFQSNRTKWMEIWITSKIDPTEVSWNKLFLAVDMRALTRFEFLAHAGSFFIDQKKNVVVVFDRDMDAPTDRGMAYIIGKNGYFRKVDLGEDADSSCYPLVCSYVPSSVQIRQLT